jgi:hypothetical protein
VLQCRSTTTSYRKDEKNTSGDVRDLDVEHAVAAVPSLIMSVVPVTQTASANGLNNLCRALGTFTASAVTGLLLVVSTTSAGNPAVPSETAIVAILLLGATAALIALLISGFIPRRTTAPSLVVTAMTPAPFSGKGRAGGTGRALLDERRTRGIPDGSERRH